MPDPSRRDLLGPPARPPRPWEGPALELASVQRALAGLAAGYDTIGPRKVGAAVKAAEISMRRVLAEGLPPKPARDARILYAQLLVMSATAACETGHYDQGIRTARHATAAALEAGDEPTAAHAWAVAAGALRITGRPHHALVAAHRSRAYAGSSPAAAMALLEESKAGAELARTHTRMDDR
jgi:hypothetical protein